MWHHVLAQARVTWPCNTCPHVSRVTMFLTSSWIMLHHHNILNLIVDFSLLYSLSWLVSYIHNLSFFYIYSTLKKQSLVSICQLNILCKTNLVHSLNLLNWKNWKLRTRNKWRAEIDVLHYYNVIYRNSAVRKTEKYFYKDQQFMGILVFVKKCLVLNDNLSKFQVKC